MILRADVCLSAGEALEIKNKSKERKPVMKKVLAVLLTLCMLASLVILPISAEETETLPKWNFTSQSDLGQRGELYHTDPLRLVGFYNGANEGWKDDGGNIRKGCYDLKHVQNWSHTTPNFGGEANIDGGYHATQVMLRWGFSAVGVIFTAPKSGTVKFVYHMSGISDASASATHYRGVGELAYDLSSHTYTADETISLDGKALADAVEYTVEVTAGETVYLMFGKKQSELDKVVHYASFYIDSVEYTSLTHYPTEATVLGMGLAADDTPRVRYIVKLNDDIGYTTYTATLAGKEVPVEVKQIIGEYSGRTFAQTDYVYSFTVGVPAKQMTDEILLSIKGKDDAELLSGTSYKVETYCLAQIETAKKIGATADEKNVGKVCASMLLYGYMAQQRFGYNTDHMPTIDKDYITGILPD